MGTSVRSLVVPLALALACAATPSYAADMGLMFKAGWDTGRTLLLQVPIADGASQQIRVNDGLYAGGGLAIVNEARSFEGELSVSYKSKQVTDTDGQVDWNKIPIDALVFYRTADFRFGAGLTYHTFVRLRGTGTTQMNVNFKNALGFIGQIDLIVGERGTIGLRFIKLEYEAEGIDYKAKSDGIGITASMSFW
jgi:hypothetical protein